jgi:hypothetical protein
MVLRPISRTLFRLHVKSDHSSWLCAACVPDLRFSHLQGGTQIRLDRECVPHGLDEISSSPECAACNRLHEGTERLARWLLMTHDRIGTVELPLTQEFLSQMLGSRRATVSISAITLQKAGLISYTHGKVKILDRPGLEKASCECYEVMRQQLETWNKELR